MFTALKKKHSKTGEESRFQGTVLGKIADEKGVRIEGGPVESIQAWEASLRGKVQMHKSETAPTINSGIPSAESSPLSEI